MGLLLDMRDVCKWLDDTSSSGTTMVLESFHESYSEMKKQKGESMSIDDARRHCKKAARLGYMKREKVNDTYNYALLEKGELIVRERFSVPTGVINAYLSNNPWVNFVIGFIVGCATVAGVVIAYFALRQPPN